MSRIKLLEGLLREAQKYWHVPDTDAYQFSCVGCGGHPRSDKPHKPDCLVVRIAIALKNDGERP